MSDKKFNFLNNLIEIIITTVILPSGRGKCADDCQCFINKTPQTFKRVTSSNNNYCLFYALELAREYSLTEEQDKPEERRRVQKRFYRLAKNQENRLKKTVNELMKNALGNDEFQKKAKNEVGYGLKHIEQVKTIPIHLIRTF